MDDVPVRGGPAPEAGRRQGREAGSDVAGPRSQATSPSASIQGGPSLSALARLFEGFTIGLSQGTGVLISGASPTLRDCVIQGAFTPGGTGAGIEVSGGSPMLDNLVFDSNSADGGSGGDLAVTNGASVMAVDCTFGGSVAASGGSMIEEAVSPPTGDPYPLRRALS
jgi:hypothetical protein